ncbi:MAG: hypothetical protein IPM34_07715 [Saprospiraceae bacterium]|nr:hypothetical protein [Saprospiraceae bacterium]
MKSTSTRFNSWIVAGILTITYGVLWLVHEYVAFFLTLVVPAVSLSILLISLITEYLERSNIPGWYYRLMLLLILIPLMIGLVMGYLFGLGMDLNGS